MPTQCKTIWSALKIKSGTSEAQACHTSIPTLSLSDALTQRTSASRTSRLRGWRLRAPARCDLMCRRQFRANIEKRLSSVSQVGIEQLLTIATREALQMKVTQCTEKAGCSARRVNENTYNRRTHLLVCNNRPISNLQTTRGFGVFLGLSGLLFFCHSVLVLLSSS